MNQQEIEPIEFRDSFKIEGLIIYFTVWGIAFYILFRGVIWEYNFIEDWGLKVGLLIGVIPCIILFIVIFLYLLYRYIKMKGKRFVISNQSIKFSTRHFLFTIRWPHFDKILIETIRYRTHLGGNTQRVTKTIISFVKAEKVRKLKIDHFLVLHKRILRKIFTALETYARLMNKEFCRDLDIKYYEGPETMDEYYEYLDDEDAFFKDRAEVN